MTLLEGVRVLDLANEFGTGCGRILADLGADVVKVEPPAGDAGRRVPPFADDIEGPERSLNWLAGNVNKRGVTCDLSSEQGRALFRRLADTADVIIESFTPGYLAGIGLAYETLAESNPRLIVVSVTPFGLEGPLATLPGSDIEVMAAGGSLWLAGYPDGSPVRNTLPQSPAWTGVAAAQGALVALLARDATGQGQQVDVSGQASMIPAIAHAPAFWDLLGEEQRRSGAYLVGRSVTGAEFRNLWPCKDGYVTFALYGGPAGRHTMRMLIQWMEERGGAPEVLKRMDWDTYEVTTVTPEEVAVLEGAIGPFLQTLTKQEFFQGVVQRNMLGYPVATVEDIRDDEQLTARDFWADVAQPWGEGSQPFPGSFALFDGERLPITRTAPRLGEHNAEVYGALGLSTDELASLRRGGVL